MKLLNIKITTLLVAILLAPSAMAQSALISEEAAMKNFKEAAKLYRKDDVDTAEPEVKKADENPQTAKEDVKESEAIAVIDQKTIDMHSNTSVVDYEPIENIVVSVNIENKTLQEVVTQIIDQAREEAGEWTVKWRVSPESTYILNERVNLTAETNLSNFMSFLVDRVNNMTGVKLFVTVFDKSRIILISDTYY
tara:strand:+ start:217233 stop:217814 length:582 start_codon:yes stop_codon:yes gene_type:complete